MGKNSNTTSRSDTFTLEESLGGWLHIKLDRDEKRRNKLKVRYEELAHNAAQRGRERKYEKEMEDKVHRFDIHLIGILDKRNWKNKGEVFENIQAGKQRTNKP